MYSEKEDRNALDSQSSANVDFGMNVSENGYKNSAEGEDIQKEKPDCQPSVNDTMISIRDNGCVDSSQEIREEKPTENVTPLRLIELLVKRIADVMHYFLQDQTLEQIDERFKPILSPMFKLAFVVGVIWFIYYYYSTEQSSHFISLKMEAGMCKEVPSPITQVYKIDTHGYWKGDTHFSLSHAIYEFDMEGFAHSTGEFTRIMGTEFRNRIERIAANATKRSLSDNLLYWMNWSEYMIDGHVKHRILMTGHAPSVFHRHSYTARIADHEFICNLTAKTRYKAGESSFRIDYDYSDYSESDGCSHILTPENWEYLASMDMDEFHITLDVKSLTTIVALNHHMLGLDMLEQVDHHDRGYVHYEHNGFDTYYHLTYFVDERYEESRPFICFISEAHSVAEQAAIDNGDIIDYFCAADHGKMFEVPFLTQMGPEGHHGLSRFAPVECTCDGGVNATALYEECQSLDLVLGTVFFQNISTGESMSFDDQFLHIMRMEYLIKDQHTHLNHLVYNATFHATVMGGGLNDTYDHGTFTDQEKIDYENLHDHEFIKHYYDFCEDLCSIVFVSMYDPHDYHINKQMYELMDGSCKDTISVSEEAWETLADWHLFPQKITQDYYDCLPSIDNSIFNAIGVALGTIELLAFVVYVTFMFFFKKTPEMIDAEEQKIQREFENRILLSVLNMAANDDENNKRETKEMSPVEPFSGVAGADPNANANADMRRGRDGERNCEGDVGAEVTSSKMIRRQVSKLIVESFENTDYADDAASNSIVDADVKGSGKEDADVENRSQKLIRRQVSKLIVDTLNGGNGSGKFRSTK